jgi:hypothetical protein
MLFQGYFIIVHGGHGWFEHFLSWFKLDCDGLVWFKANEGWPMQATANQGWSMSTNASPCQNNHFSLKILDCLLFFATLNKTQKKNPSIFCTIIIIIKKGESVTHNNRQSSIVVVSKGSHPNEQTKEEAFSQLKV